MNTKVPIGIIVVCTLVFSCVEATAENALNTSIADNKISNGSLNNGGGYEVVLDQNFSTNSMPPNGWQLLQTNPSETWYVDSTLPHSYPYCATVHRGNSLALQDEWLVSPPLDLSNYNGYINLSFYWYTNCYVAHWKDYIDLNLQVSTNNGSTWTKIWSDDNMTGNYSSWTWINTNNGKAINLSAYGGHSQTKIAFEFYSNVTDLAAYQEMSLDDIIIYAENVTQPPDFLCDCGGPYDWCWDNQHNYNPAGVRFTGNVINASWWRCRWLWDFGDNSTSTMPLNPIHDYKDIGIYNVTLMVIDNTTQPERIAFDHTVVHIFLMPAPEINVDVKSALLGIKATIMNDGIYNATQTNWSITIHSGFRQAKETVVANGTLDILGPKNSSDPLKSGFFFGLGIIHIEVNAMPMNIPGINKEFTALKFGPLVFHIRSQMN